MRLNVKIVSPEKTLYAGEADAVTVPGSKGQFEVLVNHAPIVSALSVGVVTCRGDEAFSTEISGGFIEVSANNVIICVELSQNKKGDN